MIQQSNRSSSFGHNIWIRQYPSWTKTIKIFNGQFEGLTEKNNLLSVDIHFQKKRHWPWKQRWTVWRCQRRILNNWWTIWECWWEFENVDEEFHTNYGVFK
jgi:hypothetical protein